MVLNLFLLGASLRSYRRQMFRVIFLFFFFSSQVFAQTSSVANNAMIGVLSNKLQSQGFLPNDPKLAMTLNQFNSAINGAIERISNASENAGSALQVLVSDLSNSHSSLPLDKNKTVFLDTAPLGNFKITTIAGNYATGTVPMIKNVGSPTIYVGCNPGGGEFVGLASSFEAVAGQCFNVTWNTWVSDTLDPKSGFPMYGRKYLSYSITSSLPSSNSMSFSIIYTNPGSTSPITGTYTLRTYSLATSNGANYIPECTSGLWNSSLGCATPQNLPSAFKNSVKDNISPSSLKDSIPSSVLSSPVSNEVLGAMANDAYKQTAVDQNVIPYSYSNPITTADAQAWSDKNSDSTTTTTPVPTVADVLAPSTAKGSSGRWDNSVSGSGSGNGGTASGVQTGTGSDGKGTCTATDTTCTNKTSVKVSVNTTLGDDPNIAPPNLGNTDLHILPTIFSAVSPYRNYQIATQAGSFPNLTFTALGKTFSFNVVFEFIESIRTILSSSFLLAFAIGALLIVLSA